VPTWLAVSLDEVRQALAADERAVLQRYLSGAEQTRYGQLRTEKRRLDWLAGRIAAKRLIRKTRFHQEGAVVPYSAITISADELGAPEVKVIGERGRAPRVSISHGAGLAAAMLSPSRDVRPGIDVERVEERAGSFGEQFFTDGEQRHAATDVDPHRALTTLWAVKEATLKALGIGARVDMRQLEVHRRGEKWNVRLTGEAQDRARAIGATATEVEVEQQPEHVVARVLLASSSDAATGTEVSA
jgi:phosphopantetheine--protein transferase-like protein